MVKHGILHVHSEHSMFDSTQKPEDIVKRAKELGCKNITLTDHGVLSGIDDFMDAGKKYGVNTIPGVEAYLEHHAHLVLVAKDYEGFLSISHAVRDANMHQDIFLDKIIFPIMTEDIILKYFKGNTHVIATSACIQGPIGKALLSNRPIEKKINRLKQTIDSCDKNLESCGKIETIYNEIDAKIKKYKERQKELKKYTSSAYKKAISKKKESVSSMLPILQEQFLQEIAEEEARMNDALIETESLNTYIKKLTEEKKKHKDSIGKLKKIRSRKDSSVEEIKTLEAGLKTEETLFSEAKKQALFYKSIFPEFYIEIQNHWLEDELYVMPLLAKIAEENEIPIIAANDAHMTTNSEDCIIARQTIRFNYFDKHQSVSEADKQLYIKDDQELEIALTDAVGRDKAIEAIENTACLEACSVVFPNETHYPTAEGETKFDELLEAAKEKKKKAGEWNEEYEARLEHETSVIKKMGYVDYHLIVRAFCYLARKMGTIPRNKVHLVPDDMSVLFEWIERHGERVGVGVGPGRGSAAGSLVCYLLGITNIDPIKYNLLFERFLNPERVSMPDIDTDIRTSLRQLLIRYLRWKRGDTAVCSIMTENRYAAKSAYDAAVRDRASELFGGLPKKEQVEEKKQYVARVAKAKKLITEDSLKKCEQSILSTYDSDEEIKIVLKRAELIEGAIYATGLHAGGIVMSDSADINDYVPLAWNEENKAWSTQCDMIRVEQHGLLKMDLLGLLNLDIIADCVQMVLKTRGVAVDLDNLPFEKEVFEKIYAAGKTNSVFQFESPGMKDLLKKFRPESFEDIILLIAAYRPGPMQYLDDIIAVKRGGREIKYLTPELKPILETTYGAIIYQEEVMQIFQSLAGYSLGGADLVRRAMSKKKTEKLVIEREAFVNGDESREIDGCVKRGISADVANKLFDDIMEFAKYAFNKSHAAAYAMVSYQTAYLKYHFPEEYLCAMFNNKGQDKYAPIIEDCNLFGVEVLPLSINQSYYEFVIESKKIRFGIKGLKGIKSAEPVDMIIKMRENSRRKTPFESFNDFLTRVSITDDEGKVSLPSKNIMDPLILCGAFDEMADNREALYDHYRNISKAIESVKSEYQLSVALPEFVDSEKDHAFNRAREMDYLGFVLSENPLNEYMDDEYYGCLEISDLPGNGRGNVFGLVTESTVRKSKSGKDMIILKIQGKTGTMTAIAMGAAYIRYHEMDLSQDVYRFTGRFSDKTMFVDRIEKLYKKRNSYIYYCDTIEKMNSCIPKINKDSAPEAELKIVCLYGGNDGTVLLDAPQVTKTYFVSLNTIKALGATPEKGIGIKTIK